MGKVKTWNEKSAMLNKDIEKLILKHSKNFSKGIIQDRFNEYL